MSQINLIISCLYTYCSNGSTVTNICNEFARDIYSSHWYQYPIKVQPFIILMMSRAQKPFYFTGYEFGKCSMENFTAVNNNFKRIKIFMVFIRVLFNQIYYTVSAHENVIFNSYGFACC